MYCTLRIRKENFVIFSFYANRHTRTFEPISALQRQFRLYIPFLGIARPQPQFLLYIHVSVSDLYILRIGPHTVFPPAETAAPSWEYIIRSQTHEYVEIGTEAPIFLFWKYLLPILGIFSLQCATIQPKPKRNKIIDHIPG
jgi:hypothetical protein